MKEASEQTAVTEKKETKRVAPEDGYIIDIFKKLLGFNYHVMGGKKPTLK